MDLGIKRGIRFVMLENPIVSLKPKIPNTIKKKQFPMEWATGVKKASVTIFIWSQLFESGSKNSEKVPGRPLLSQKFLATVQSRRTCKIDPSDVEQAWQSVSISMPLWARL